MKDYRTGSVLHICINRAFDAPLTTPRREVYCYDWDYMKICFIEQVLGQLLQLMILLAQLS